MAYSPRNNNKIKTSSLQDSPTYGIGPDLVVSNKIDFVSSNANVIVNPPNYSDTIDLGPEVSTKTIHTTFGREEDYIELHINNIAGQLVYSETNFQDYILNDLKNDITINPEKILVDRGYTSGIYIINLHLFRDKIFLQLF